MIFNSSRPHRRWRGKTLHTVIATLYWCSQGWGYYVLVLTFWALAVETRPNAPITIRRIPTGPQCIGQYG